jgi:hypothetical protein
MSHKYMVLLRNQPGSPAPSPERMQQMFAAYNAWKERFAKQIVDMGDKLKPDGRVVSASGVVDGPFVEVKELIGGYMMVSADDYDGAIAVVRACPALDSPGVTMEIRELVGYR